MRWGRFCFPHDPKYFVLSTKEVQEEQLGSCLGESGGEMLTVTTTTTTVRKACGLWLIPVLMLGQYHWKGSRWPQKISTKISLGVPFSLASTMKHHIILLSFITEVETTSNIIVCELKSPFSEWWLGYRSRERKPAGSYIFQVILYMGLNPRGKGSLSWKCNFLKNNNQHQLKEVLISQKINK